MRKPQSLAEALYQKSAMLEHRLLKTITPWEELSPRKSIRRHWESMARTAEEYIRNTNRKPSDDCCGGPC